MSRRYFICKNDYEATVGRTYEPVGSVLDWSCFSLHAEDKNSIAALPGYAVEVTKEVAVFGFRSWGDVRSTIKVSAADVGDNEEFDNLSYADMTQGAKVAVPVTEKRYNTILRTMKLCAKIIIEDTFNSRFAALDDGAGDLEKKVWEFLKDDVENGTDFILSELAEAKGVSADDLRSLVVQKRDAYNKSVKDLHLKAAALKTKFYNCTTIRQLNRLYEDYMGIPMPLIQAEEEGRVDQDGQHNEVVPGLKF